MCLQKIVGFCERKSYDLEKHPEPSRQLITFLFFVAVGCAVGGCLTGYLAKRYSLKNPGFLVIGMTMVGGVLIFSLIMAPVMIGVWSCNKKNRELLKREREEWMTAEGKPTEKALQQIQRRGDIKDSDVFYPIHFSKGVSAYNNTIAVEFCLQSGDKRGFEVPAVSCTSYFGRQVYCYPNHHERGMNPAMNREEEHGVVFACILREYMELIERGTGLFIVKIVDDKKNLMCTYPDCKIVNEPYPHLLVDSTVEYPN